VAYRGVWRRQPRNRSRVPIEPRWQAPVPEEVVASIISGRHEEAGEYLMVAAAVHARIDATRSDRSGVGFAAVRGGPTLDATVALTAEAVGNLPEPPDGPIVAEGGEFYEEPAGRVGLLPTRV